MLKRAGNEGSNSGPIGLDDRPRPASSRARIVRGLKQSAPFSSLQRRIIFFNLIGLAMLVGASQSVFAASEGWTTDLAAAKKLAAEKKKDIFMNFTGSDW